LRDIAGKGSWHKAHDANVRGEKQILKQFSRSIRSHALGAFQVESFDPKLQFCEPAEGWLQHAVGNRRAAHDAANTYPTE
jgi:hypothetical protein